MKITVGKIRALVAEASSVDHTGFVASIKKQFTRARDAEDLAHIADAYDAIVGALMMPEHRQDEWYVAQDAFTKWHFRQAKQQMNAGTLSLDDLPSGDELYSQEEHRRETVHASQAEERERAAERYRNKTPEERAHDEKMAVYGGEENYRKGVGLGT